MNKANILISYPQLIYYKFSEVILNRHILLNVHTFPEEKKKKKKKDKIRFKSVQVKKKKEQTPLKNIQNMVEDMIFG